jgi:LuxR family transcriptional regulator, maltose regulon positive regulatory protein
MSFYHGGELVEPDSNSYSSVKEYEQHTALQGTNLLGTKFYVPPIGSIHIPRPHLIEYLNNNLDKSVFLISAPAGYGKTTLVSEWLKETDLPSAWLSLDSGDNDPNRFLQYLLAALTPIAPGIRGNLSGMLLGIQSAQIETFLTILINELASEDKPFILVFDDFHVLQSEPVLDITAYLINHLPKLVHIVIITRIDPPFPLARMRLNGQLLDLRADHLRFTRSEIGVFLNDATGLTLTHADLSVMESRTEGWIAGLQLASLSIKNTQDVHAFVQAFAGSQRYIMDYLAEEVLKSLPKELSTFLLQTSVLDRLCGPLCEAIVDSDHIGLVNGHEILTSLEDLNLFTIALDDERKWYRYHHLFADVLKKRLNHDFPHLMPEIYQRASQWYEQNGFIAESIQNAIFASDQVRAADLIEKNGCFLLISGEVSTLLNWTEAIDFQSETRPWLAIQKAWALALSGDLEQVEPLLQIPNKLLSPLEQTDEVKTMQGTIAAARANCANLRGDTFLAAKYARDALDLLPCCSSIAQSIRSVATLILGDASWIHGDLAAAIKAYEEASQIGREARNSHMITIANSNIAEILFEQGRLQSSSSTLSNALIMAVRPDGQRSPLAGSLLLNLGRMAYEQNSLNDADHYLHQCIDLCQKWGAKDQQSIAQAILARVAKAQGNPEKTQSAILAAEQCAGLFAFTPRATIKLRTELGRSYLALEKFDSFSQLVKSTSIGVDDEINYLHQPDYVLFLRQLLFLSEHEKAIKLSEQLIQQANDFGRTSIVLECLILQSLAFYAKKNNEESLSSLARAFELAQTEEYVRLFLDEGEVMTRLLCLAQARQIGNGCAGMLLAALEKTTDSTPLSMQLLVEPLTDREIEVLQLIKTGCSNNEIAEKFFISMATVKRHISNIYSKLGVKSRTQAIAIGIELKILD